MTRSEKKLVDALQLAVDGLETAEAELRELKLDDAAAKASATIERVRLMAEQAARLRAPWVKP